MSPRWYLRLKVNSTKGSVKKQRKHSVKAYVLRGALVLMPLAPALCVTSFALGQRRHREFSKRTSTFPSSLLEQQQSKSVCGRCDHGAASPCVGEQHHPQCVEAFSAVGPRSGYSVAGGPKKEEEFSLFTISVFRVPSKCF
jgi:hypothetical protein